MQDCETTTVLDHVMPVPGGSWAMWRCMVLRATGFPANRLLALAAPECAAAADRLLELEERIDSLCQEALRSVNEELDELRAAGAWDDVDRRKPLLRAVRELSRGKVPKGLDGGSLGAVCETLRRSRSGIDEAAAEVERLYESARESASTKLGEVLDWDLFREAVLWQNRKAASVLFGGSRSKSGASMKRRHEELVANYLQRYCVKNDTIGFFGPVGWAQLTDVGDTVRARPGERLVDRREVYFENWCINALAQKIGEAPEIRPWLAPRLKSSVHLEGNVLSMPFKPSHRLSEDEARVLALCDGRRPAREIAAVLVADPDSGLAEENEVFEALESFSRRRIVLWTLEVPLEIYPERYLRGQLERIEDERIGGLVLEMLSELVEAKDQVASAAGNAADLEEALRGLEETFSRLTGMPPQRQQRAARGLVYEDCRRSLEIELGPEFLARLGPPLTLILESGQWLAGELTRRVEEKMRALHAKLRERGGADHVESFTLISQVVTSLFLKKKRDEVFLELEREFQARWARVFRLTPGGREQRVSFEVADLRRRVSEEFGDVHPSWSYARYCGPDVMIAAESEEELRLGNFQVVLGEIHSTSYMTWSCFMSQHPSPEAIHRWVEDDMDTYFGMGSKPVVMMRLPRNMLSQRMSVSLVLPRIHFYDFGDDPPDSSARRHLRSGSVVIEDGGEGLVARTRDGGLCFPAIDLLSHFLTNESNRILGALLERSTHQPRITVGDVVLSRERWSFVTSEAASHVDENDPRSWFVGLRRWARAQGLPRFCFYKFPSEPKPCYLDLDSLVYVDLFVKMLRKTAKEEGPDKTFWLAEMLPRTDQTWLTDAEGDRYTCELRTTAYDLCHSSSTSRAPGKRPDLAVPVRVHDTLSYEKRCG